MNSFVVFILCLASANAAVMPNRQRDGNPVNYDPVLDSQGNVIGNVPVAETTNNLDGRNVVYTSGSASSGTNRGNNVQTVAYVNNNDCGLNTIYTTTQASAVLTPAGGNVTGNIVFDQPNGVGAVIVTGTVYGLGANSAYGFQIHEFGNIANGCAAPGEPFNPDGYPHGDLSDPIRQAGDLGNIVSDENGVARINLESNAFTLNGDYDITGRTIAVHSQRDDGGRGGTSTTGNSGAPRACGVIGINAERMDDNRGQRDNENRGQRDNENRGQRNKENRGQQKDRNH